MNEISQLIVNVHINSKLSYVLHFPNSHPQSIDHVLTKFVKEHQIKDKAIPYLKQQIKRQLFFSRVRNQSQNEHKQSKLSTEKKIKFQQQKIQNALSERKSLNRKQNKSISPNQKNKESVEIKEFKVKDLEAQMEEQIRILKMEKKIEKLDKKLKELFEKLRGNIVQKDDKGLQRILQLVEGIGVKQIQFNEFKEHLMAMGDQAKEILEYLQ